MRKKLFLSLFTLAFALIYAQNDTKTIAETDFVKIETSEKVCKSVQGWDFLYQSLRFENKTTESIVITYNFEVWHEDICQTCGGDHGPIRSLEIPALGVIEGECTDMYNQNLMVLDHSLTVHPNAPKFKLTEIVINKIQKD